MIKPGSAFFLLVLVLPVAAPAAVFQLPALADGFVQDSGALGLSSGDSDPTIRTSRSGGSNVRQGMYEFDLSSLPSGVTILSASFTMTTAGTVSDTDAAVSLRLDGYTGDGLITVADYDDLEASGGTLIASLDLPVGAGTPIGSEIVVPLTALAALEVAFSDPAQIFGIRTETTNFSTFTIHSTETANGAVQVPTLTITTIPEPTPSLLASASVALLLLRRKRGVEAL